MSCLNKKESQNIDMSLACLYSHSHVNIRILYFRVYILIPYPQSTRIRTYRHGNIVFILKRCCHASMTISLWALTVFLGLDPSPPPLVTRLWLFHYELSQCRTRFHNQLSQWASWVRDTELKRCCHAERWGAGVEYHFQEFNEPYAPS